MRTLGLCLLVATVLPAQQSDGLQPIAGRVVGADGKAVGGARVTIRWRAHPELPGLIGHSLGDHGIVERDVFSDGRGRFRFVPMHSGPFLLVAHDGETSSAQGFPVACGDFHTLELEPTFFYGGTVRDGANAPAVGAVVEILPTALMWARAGFYNQPERRGRAVTDADGRFRLPFEHGYLRDARWNVLMGLFASKGDAASAGLAVQRPTTGARDNTVTLVAGSVVRGQVTSGGRAIAGATVFDPGVPGRRVTTGANGSFELFAPSGELLVHARGHQLAEARVAPRTALRVVLQRGTRLSVTFPKRLRGATVLIAALVADDQAPVEWTDVVGDDGSFETASMTPGRPHLGFVEVDGRFVQFYDDVPNGAVTIPLTRLPRAHVVRGQVRDVEGVPVAGARVALRRRGPSLVPFRIAFTDRGGRFTFDGVVGKPLSIAAACRENGFVGMTLTKLPADSVVLTFPRGAAIGGTVLLANGKPAADAWVTVYRTANANEPMVPAPRQTMTSVSTFTDSNGRFRVGGLAAGSWTVVTGHIHDGIHYNATLSTRVGRSDVKLALSVSQR